VFLALAVVVASGVFTWVHRTTSQEYGPAALEPLMRGEGWTPFQYRILVPHLVRALRDGAHLPLQPQSIALGIEMLAIVALFYAQRALTRALVGERRLVIPSCFALFGVLSFQYLQSPRWWYVYDIPSVLLFTLGVLLIHRARWGWLAICIALGELNREVICLLVPLLLLTWYDRLRPLKLLSVAAGLSLVWTGLRLLQVSMFPDTPGGGQYDAQSLVRNLNLLNDPESWPKLLACFGGLWLVVLAGWRYIRPSFVRRALWIVPVHFVLVFRFGAFAEVRVYGEVAPLVLLGATCALDGWICVRREAQRAALRAAT